MPEEQKMNGDEKVPDNDKDTQKSREKILYAAKKLFSERGFDGTSTREISKEAGLNISLISYHFGGKENVFLAIFDEFLEKRMIQNQHQNSSADLMSEFTAILQEVIRLRFDDPEIINILQQEIVMKSNRVDKIKQFVSPLWNRIRELLDEGREKGFFAFEDLNNAVSFVMSVIIFPRHNLFIIDLCANPPLSEDLCIQETVSFILKGLKKTSE
ncbi:TetR/AcrR family transcriptional regulator [Brevibacillus massiliensis]|uniref:TetR/AcrR family transcriptional regulator n=1 Tax=Brevibacillus massiliensis TaxID=1118054 RepID=UPI0002DBC24D|nr:TetR/AcrR family transcriptional regulator [Brevibacillus massiliensis]